MHSFGMFRCFADLSLIQFDSELPSYFRQKRSPSVERIGKKQ